MEPITCIFFSKEVFAAILTVAGAYIFGKKALKSQYKVQIARELYAARYLLANGNITTGEITVEYGPAATVPSLILNGKYAVGAAIGTSIKFDSRKEWNYALNSVQIVFARDKKVMKCLSDLRKNAGEKEIRSLLLEVGIAAGLLGRFIRHTNPEFDPVEMFHSVA